MFWVCLFLFLNICVSHSISGRIEVEHVISKKLQLKKKAEVSRFFKKWLNIMSFFGGGLFLNCLLKSVRREMWAIVDFLQLMYFWSLAWARTSLRLFIWCLLLHSSFKPCKCESLLEWSTSSDPLLKCLSKYSDQFGPLKGWIRTSHT